MSKRKEMALVFYHVKDDDGQMCAAIYEHAFKKGKFKYEPFYAPINPGRDHHVEDYFFEGKDTPIFKEVYILDVTLLPREMLFLKAKRDKGELDVFWYDHHFSSIEDSEREGYDDFKGVRICPENIPFKTKGKSACEIFYLDTFYDGHIDMFGDKPVHVIENKKMNVTLLPACIVLISRYDVWDREAYGELVDLLHFGLETKKTYYKTDDNGTPNRNQVSFLRGLLDEDNFIEESRIIGEPVEFLEGRVKNLPILNRVIQDGYVIRDLMKKKFREMSFGASFGTFKGNDGREQKLILLNHTKWGSLPFEMIENERDLNLVYHVNGDGKVFFGVYSGNNENSDALAVAKHFDKNGGGHKCSAGFRLMSLKALADFFKEIDVHREFIRLREYSSRNDRVFVTGSDTLNARDFIFGTLSNHFVGDFTVLSGMNNDVEKNALDYALTMGLPSENFPVHDGETVLNRNKRIFDSGVDHLIIFSDGNDYVMNKLSKEARERGITTATFFVKS